MKLVDLYEAEERNISEEDMEHVYKKVIKRELDTSEVLDLAKELVDDGEFSRNAGSARFIINRMHILIHGMAPHGVTERSAETMFNSAKPLVAFIEKKGHDADANIGKARDEITKRPVKVKKDVALKQLSDFFKANKAKYTPDEQKKLRDGKDTILKDIMVGAKAAEAFAKLIN